jgi:1-acyl-sn-glycerol-3-phosphate acyltransferase
MEYIKHFYLIPWTLWCGISFFCLTGICALLVAPLLLINSKTTYRWAHELPTITAKLISYCWLVRIKSIGLENFDPKSQYIFVGNHRSMLDAIISSGFIPNAKKFIGKAEILNYPFLGYILKRLYIPVKRQDKASRLWSKEQLMMKMKEGFSMVIFAEGTCNYTDTPLLEFKDGAFEASCALQIPLVPFVIDKADILWHRNTWLISPGFIILKFLSIRHPQENKAENILSMKREVYHSIYTEYLAMTT